MQIHPFQRGVRLELPAHNASVRKCSGSLPLPHCAILSAGRREVRCDTEEGRKPGGREREAEQSETERECKRRKGQHLPALGHRLSSSGVKKKLGYAAQENASKNSASGRGHHFGVPSCGMGSPRSDGSLMDQALQLQRDADLHQAPF